MDTKELSLFLVVAREGSFAGAARELDRDPSSVSRAVGNLEGELGVRLFHRTTRTMTLTDAGRAYLARVAPAVEELARARDEVRSSRSDPTGTVRVTASVAFGQTCMVPLMSAFRRAYPRLSLELLMTDANLDLIEDRIDIAVRLGPSRRADVQAEKLFDTRYRVCASPRYVDKNGAPERPNDLRERDCVLMALTAFRSRWLFRMKGTVEEIPVAGNLVFSTALAVRSATVDSLGPALLPDWLIGGDLRSGSLVDLFPDYDVTATTFETAAWMLYPSADYIPKRVQATMDFLRREVQP